MTFDLAEVRGSFPILSRRISGQPLTYLDSAATSLTPDEVLEAELGFYRNVRGNVRRGAHALSQEASAAFAEARARIARFIGAASDEVVFTANTSAALNLVAAGLRLPGDSEVLTTLGEHHSTLLPWRTRWAVRAIESSPLRPLEPETLRRAMGRRTRAVVLGHASNVTGLVQPIAELCRVASEQGAISVVDAAQSAPHLPLDVERIGCDFLAFSGHKMLGPMGVGVLYGRRAALVRLQPRDLGGGVVDRVTSTSHELLPPPECFEVGTPNVAGAIGLAAAVAFLENLGWEAIQSHARSLSTALVEGTSSLPGVRRLAAEGEALPIVSLLLDHPRVTVTDLAVALSDRYGVMVRSGLLCAHPLFEALRRPDGVLRASAYLYNSLDDVRTLCGALEELLRAFGA
jgi:cysteine desulfurase/selenocysteine lyase